MTGFLDKPPWWRRISATITRVQARLHKQDFGITDMVFVLTDKGHEELKERKLGLVSRMRALLVLVNGERSGADLLHAVAGLELDEVSLVGLFRLDLIRPDRDDQLEALDLASAAMFEPMDATPAETGARRVLSRKDYDHFIGKTDKTFVMPPEAMVAFEKVGAADLAAIKAEQEAAAPHAVDKLHYEALNLNAMRHAMAQELTIAQRQLRARILKQRGSAPADSVLSENAEAMILHLAGRADLRLLLQGYPRAVNKLADNWEDPAAFLAEVDAMLLDSRGDRKGFPFEVITELSDLKTFYYEHVADVI